MRNNKLSIRQPEQNLVDSESGEPLPCLAAPHHIRPHGYPIAIGMHGGYQPPVQHSLAVREKDVVTQPLDVNNKTAAKASAYFGKQNYWHQDRLAYLVPGTAASTGPITN